MFSPEFVTYAAAADGGLAIGLRLNWFRPLPLSCVEALTVSLPGEPLPPGVLTLDGTRYAVAALGDHEDVWWSFLSDAELFVPCTRPVDGAGVRVTMSTRIPLFVDHTGAAVTVTDTSVLAVAA